MQAPQLRCCFLSLLAITACASAGPTAVSSFRETSIKLSTSNDVGAVDPAFAHCPVIKPFEKRAMWVWHSRLLEDPSTRSEVFSFATSHRIHSIYLQSERLIFGNPDALGEIVDAAAERCIRIELLFGQSSWALSMYHGKPLTLARTSVEFADALTGARPTAVHFDIEPYTLDEWAADASGTANQLVDLYEQLRDIMAASDMDLVADIPFWYDGRLVDRGDGHQRPLNQLIADRTDRVAIMDYRDTAERIIESGQTELDYAESIGRQVVIGVETMAIEPEDVTFQNEGTTVMWAELRTAVASFSAMTAFQGVAFHYYLTWRDLEARTILRESRIRMGISFFSAALSPGHPSE